MEERQPIRVSELNLYIKEVFDRDPLLRRVAVQGEISNFKANTSGHLYFSLKDEGGAIRCVMFRGAAGKLRYTPENGMKVIAVGDVSTFPRDGQYQLYVTSMTPEGVGDLYVAFAQMQARLGQEGLFDPGHKKPLPPYPNKIALITSPTGAAVRDMLRVLRKRYPMAKVLVVPVKVQGAGAAEEIASAIRYVDSKRIVDLIITGRGGGSIEDLWCFNEEIVARAIYQAETPIISAVGHEPDVTIADMVADVRAATPSNGAELAVPDATELCSALGQTFRYMENSVRNKLHVLSQRVENAAQKKVLSSPVQYLDERRLALDYGTERFASAAERLLTAQSHHIAQYAAKLHAMSPLQVLSRGYAIALAHDDTAVRNSADIAVGEQLTLCFAKGRARCTVTETEGETHGTEE